MRTVPVLVENGAHKRAPYGDGFRPLLLYPLQILCECEQIAWDWCA